MTRRLAEEHDMRRLEQMEMQQRFDNNEKAGKTDITELFAKVRREQVMYYLPSDSTYSNSCHEKLDRLQCDMIYDSFQEARENDADELREKIIANKSVLDERIIKEKQVEMTKSVHSYHLKKISRTLQLQLEFVTHYIE